MTHPDRRDRPAGKEAAMPRTISHYTVAHTSGDGSVVTTEITDRDRAWAFMREVEALGGRAGFPQAVFK
ncbi:hypothetical protein I5G60_gp91 [Mycobacterium phage Saguaro]|uniref:Uncharacterized protein n=1 Tax=Mycobacterium phage Saguaro TaxID=2315616 RepID=A0A386K9Z9_9CAUD|nr:hypothetical protein I5G60_gp91 [Mycobacterium phage Saguaro]AYD82083.1 hypothetical protein SEA_SAGUARO_91 [Mycobacterium phage Saguaro]